MLKSAGGSREKSVYAKQNMRNCLLPLLPDLVLEYSDSVSLI